MIISLIPIISILYLLFFLKHNHSNALLVVLTLFSSFIFASNYFDYGFEISLFRYVHRVIGIMAVLGLAFYIISNKVNIFKEDVTKILLFFFLALLISFIGNEIYQNYYLHYIRNFIFISSIALYLYFKIDSNEKLEEVFTLIIALTSILSFFILVDSLQYGWGSRVKLFFPNGNYLAYTLLLGLVLGLHLLKTNLRLFFIPIVVIAIFATGSRAAELAVIFILVLFFYKNINKKIYFSISCIGLFSILIVFFDQIIINKSVSNSRIVIAKIAINIFKANPVNGMGYGQFRKSFHHYIDQEILDLNSYEVNDVFFANNPNSSLLPESYKNLKEIDKNYIIKHNMEKMTHNDFLTIISELGLIGIAALFYIFFKLFLQLKKLLLHNKNYYYISLSSICGSIIFSLFHNNITSFLFWFILFIPFIINRNLLHENNP